MRTELTDQVDIIRSLIREGGYGKKWATRFSVGVPDLIGACPGVGMFLMEVKVLDIVLPIRSDHEFDVTPKQRHELESYAKAEGLSLLGAVLRVSKNKRITKRLLVMPWHFQFLSEYQNLFPSRTEGCPWDPHYQIYTGIVEAISYMKGRI
jgi:hypothetical protein